MKKIWKRLFFTLAMVFAIFALTILLTSTTLLKSFFVWYEKGMLPVQANTILSLDLSDREKAAERLEAIEKNHNVKIAIFEDNTLIYYTLRQSGLYGDSTGFDLGLASGMLHGSYHLEERETDARGGTFATISDDNGDGYLLYTLSKGTVLVQLIMELSLIRNSATISGVFSIAITAACLVVALIWAVIYARKFARPISEMNEIAVGMTRLDFSRRVQKTSNDEIGELADSINNLSDSLSHAMAELKEKNARLEHEIEQERRLDTMRKQFVANVSHELKTPISIIQGYAEGLRDGMAEDEQSRDHYVNVILEESERMYQLVIHLLELSKVEGGFDSHPTDFDLSAVTLSVLDLLSAGMEQKQVQVQFDLPEKWVVHGDEMLLGQSVRNYVANAISHVPSGGVVRVYAEPYHDAQRLCVYNSGSTLSEEEMNQIWEPFYRADQARNRKEGRYGLGLSIVKAIMIAHKADFGVFTESDGVTFWFEVKNKTEQ